MVDYNRRDILRTGGAAAVGAAAATGVALTPRERVPEPIAARMASPLPTPVQKPAPNTAHHPDGELKIEHLPRSYEEILALSNEQKIMLSAVVASGCDAVAYYTKNAQDKYELNKHIDLYNGNSTRFDDTIIAAAPRVDGPPRETKAENGDITYQIPVITGDTVKGIIVLHESNVKTMADERDQIAYASKAKLKMAQDIVNEHADLFGNLDVALKARAEALHRSLPQKRQFFMTLVKDMFATFLRDSKNPVDPQRHRDVATATTAAELRRALRAHDAASPVDQYSHVIGVTDLMSHTMRKAVNADGKPPVMNDAQIELMELLTLLHDVGKTQIASHLFQPGYQPSNLDEAGDNYRRNGNHPLFTLLTLLMYERDALTTAAHHSGIKRYGPEEIHSLQNSPRIRREFNQFTELGENGDIKARDLPALSKLMRIADVTEAITGRADKPLHEAISQLGAIGKDGERFKMVRQNQDGSYKVTPDTVDPHYLCFMLANGVFEEYGRQREAETQGWMSKPQDAKGKQAVIAAQPKYDANKLIDVKARILHEYGWDNPQIRTRKEAEIRTAIERDALIQENHGPAQIMLIRGR